VGLIKCWGFVYRGVQKAGEITIYHHGMQFFGIFDLQIWHNAFQCRGDSIHLIAYGLARTLVQKSKKEITLRRELKNPCYLKIIGDVF